MLLFAKRSTTIAVAIALYLISTSISWAAFSLLSPSGVTTPGQVDETRDKVGEGLPKTEACPINGAMFSKPEREIWETRRPITAIIENHADSRPPSGLSKADVIYEAVAEGGITRFLTVFYCSAAAEDVRIGPIRSARVYLIDWASEYGEKPIFVHVGGANNICSNCPGGVKPRGQVAKEVLALEKLINLDWRYAKGNALDGGANAGFPEMWRDYERIPGAATEHTYMASTDKLSEEAISRGFAFKGEDGNPWTEMFQTWKFVEDNPISDPKAKSISFEFWSNKPDYNVRWEYDQPNNKYLRFNGDKKHYDMDNDQQLSAKNVMIMFVKERGPVDSEGHMYYETLGGGKAIAFQNGDVTEGTWEKKQRTDRVKFYDESGDEIPMVKGVTWIEAVPTGNEIEY